MRSLVLLPALFLVLACSPDSSGVQPERDTDTLDDPALDPVVLEVDGDLNFGETDLREGDFSALVVRAYGPPRSLCDLGAERCAYGSVLVQTPTGPTRYEVLRLDVDGSAGRAEAVVQVREESGRPGPHWFHFIRIGGPCGGDDPDCSMTLTVEDSRGHVQRARWGTLKVSRSGG